MVAKKTELNACPFCGATALLQTDKMVDECNEAPAETLESAGVAHVSEEQWFVVCGDCGAMGPMSPSAEEARAAWNKRAGKQRKQP